MMNYSFINHKQKILLKDVVLHGAGMHLNLEHEMSLSQLIFTSTCAAEMTPRMSHLMALQSVNICQQYGLTGRAFANDISAFAITEGPTDVAKKYFHAIQADPLVDTLLLHVERPIEQREFQDFSVWLNSRANFDFGPFVGVLTPESFRAAMPENPSPRLRIMIEAFRDEVLAA